MFRSPIIKAIALTATFGIATEVGRNVGMRKRFNLAEMKPDEVTFADKDQYQFLTNNEKQNLKYTQIAIKQAFKDTGFDKPIFIIFNKNTAMPGDMRAGVSSIVFNGQRSAVVVFQYGNNYNIQGLQALGRAYAIAGHEAIHVKHEHFVLQSVFSAGITQAIYAGFKLMKPRRTWSDLILVGAAYYGAHQFIAKNLERDADISSAMKLGTAADLAAFFAEFNSIRLPNYAKFIIAIIDEHPSFSQRIKYLQKYDLFNSTLYQQKINNVIAKLEKDKNSELIKLKYQSNFLSTETSRFFRSPLYQKLMRESKQSFIYLDDQTTLQSKYPKLSTEMSEANEVQQLCSYPEFC